MSGNDTGDDYDLTAVTDASDDGLGSIAHGRALNELTEAVMARDPRRVADARARVTDALGERGMTDAAATIAAFNAYPRAADATGIPLEDAKRDGTAELRAELQLEELNTARV